MIDSAARDFIFRCIPNAALMAHEETEFGTRKSTGQRNTNSTVNGSRSGNQVSVPLGQHYVGKGIPAQGPRQASPAAPQGETVQINRGPQPVPGSDIGKTQKQISQERKAARHAAAERRRIAMQQAAEKKKAAAAAKRAARLKAAAAKKAARAKAAAQKKAARGSKRSSHAKGKSGHKRSAKSKGPHRTHSQSASAQKRVPKGQTGGGRFAPGAARSGTAGTTGQTYAQIQADPHNQQLYSGLVSRGSAQQRSYVSGLSNSDLQRLTGIAYSSRTSNPSVVRARFSVANEMAKRGISRQAYGALG